MAALVRHQLPLFALATLGGVVHAVDEVFFAKEAYRAIPLAVISIAATVAYDRLSAVVRGVAALVFGIFWLGGIATHWVPLLRDGASPGDWTSLASVPAGLLFVALGVAILARERRAADPTS